MCAFYTPIFERGWVKELLEQIAAERKESELSYEKDDQEEEYED